MALYSDVRMRRGRGLGPETLSPTWAFGFHVLTIVNAVRSRLVQGDTVVAERPGDRARYFGPKGAKCSPVTDPGHATDGAAAPGKPLEVWRSIQARGLRVRALTCP